MPVKNKITLLARIQKNIAKLELKPEDNAPSAKTVTSYKSKIIKSIIEEN